jgi:hypothetical protein
MRGSGGSGPSLAPPGPRRGSGGFGAHPRPSLGALHYGRATSPLQKQKNKKKNKKTKKTKKNKKTKRKQKNSEKKTFFFGVFLRTGIKCESRPQKAKNRKTEVPRAENAESGSS